MKTLSIDGRIYLMKAGQNHSVCMATVSAGFKAVAREIHRWCGILFCSKASNQHASLMRGRMQVSIPIWCVTAPGHEYAFVAQGS